MIISRLGFFKGGFDRLSQVLDIVLIDSGN